MRRLLDETNVQRLERRAAFCLATFTAFVGAALGGVTDVIAGDPHTLDFVIRSWVTVGLTVLALVAAAASWRSWRRRNRLLRDRGTAYVVDSPAEGWTPEEKNVFLSGAKTEMAQVFDVPGPTGLTSWRWPLGAGADRWSDAVDDLVLSFRSVWTNDNRATPDGLVCWAPFPVAVAWTARACTADRSLRLAVRQRPSRGRAGPIDVPDWDQGIHTFDTPIAAPAPNRTRPVRTAKVDLAGNSTPPNLPTPAQARILLVRLHAAEWADVTLDDDAPLDLHVENRTGQDLGLGPTVEFHEWRCLPEPGPMHPWRDYPALVAQICDWIAATAHPTGVNLLGMIAPQEISLGIGVNASRRSPNDWPAHLWPLVKPSRTLPLTIPGLDLGFASLHRTYLDRPR